MDISRRALSPFWLFSFVVLTPLLVALILVADVHESELNTRVVWTIIVIGLVNWTRLFPLTHLLAPLLILAGSIDLLYAIAFHGVFSTATFEAIVATNPTEAIEFIPAYATFINTLALVCYVGISIWLWRRTQPLPTTKSTHVWFIISLLLLTLVGVRMADGKSRDSLFGVISAGISYQQANQGIEQEIRHRQALLQTYQQNHTVTQDAHAPKTLVVVIGESMNRNHLGLYGYPRDTTPNLSALAQSNEQHLFVFHNVISSHVQTQPSLRYALTQASLLDKTDPFNSLSIIDLAKLADIKTWWLSNQQPLRGSLTAIAKQADYEYYVSNDHHGIADTLDEALLPKLAQALSAPEERKLIVLHLMGSHLQYGNRYPESFAYFQGEPPQAYQTSLSSRQHTNINEYDNSVRYTDFVLGEIFKQMTKLPTNHSAGLIFFSDHGEEVYDTTDFKGHGPESITRSMFEIPLLIWLNAQAQNDHPEWVKQITLRANAPTMLDHIDQTIGQLLGLSYDTAQAQHSLIDDAWQEHPRLVYGKNYDTQIRTSDGVK